MTIGKLPSAKDLNDKITEFFEANQAESPYLKEIIELNKYKVKFKTQDVAYNFKKFWFYIKKNEELFKDITIELDFPKKMNIGHRNNNNSNNKHKHIVAYACNSSKLKLINTKPTNNIAYSPFITPEEIRKKEYQEDKKNWITEKGFL